MFFHSTPINISLPLKPQGQFKSFISPKISYPFGNTILVLSSTQLSRMPRNRGKRILDSEAFEYFVKKRKIRAPDSNISIDDIKHKCQQEWHSMTGNEKNYYIKELQKEQAEEEAARQVSIRNFLIFDRPGLFRQASKICQSQNFTQTTLDRYFGVKTKPMSDNKKKVHNQPQPKPKELSQPLITRFFRNDEPATEETIVSAKRELLTPKLEPVELQ